MGNYVIRDGELIHAGVKGMRWGVRRYQNEDGTLTPAGKKRYSKGDNGIVADRPKGDRGNWGRDPMSKRKQKWLDDNGINPNRPYGTKPGFKTSTKIGELARYKNSPKVKSALKGVLTGVGLTATAAVVAPAAMVGWGLVKMNMQ